MDNKKIVHLVPHTHWDREWYFSINDAALLSTYNFEKVCDVLESNPDFPSFCLDGQTSIIEDVIELKPELKERINKLVMNGRIFIGPWYTQTDSFYVDGESYIRNLYFGTQFAKEMGHSMKVGYLPDTFGHNIQTPQLFKGFGIDNVLFLRGYDPSKFEDIYFNWKALDGSSVLGVNLTYGYFAGHSLNGKSEDWNNRWKPIIENITKDTKYNTTLMPQGGDQVLIVEDLVDIVSEMNKKLDEQNIELKISDYEQFVGALKNEVGDLSKLESKVTEFRDPVKYRVHRTIGSSRYDLKKKSFELEHKLVNILEPLSILVKELVDEKLVNNTVIKKAWKLLLDGHAHDSIGACNTDITNQNIMNRFNKADNLIDGTINLFKKIIGENINEQYHKDLVLYNFDMKEIDNDWVEFVAFSKEKNIEIYDGENPIETVIVNTEEIPGGRTLEITADGNVDVFLPPYYIHKIKAKVTIDQFGYKSYSVKNVENDPINKLVNNQVENENLIVNVINDEINITNKITGEVSKNLIEIENVANDGESYDFSPIADDVPIKDWKITNVMVEEYSVDYKAIKFEAEINIPTHLVERKNRSDSYVKQIFNFKMLIHKNTIEFEIDTVNVAKDHRFRLKLNTKKNYNKTLLTDVQFGFIEREYIEPPLNWKEFMEEKPENYFPIVNSFVAKGESSNLEFHAKGMKEIELTKDGDIFLTLYKADGYLGKEDLEWRPGRPSGIGDRLVETPDAQLFNQKLSFEFKMILNESGTSEKEIFENKRKYISKFDSYQVQELDGFHDRLERFQLPIGKYDIPDRNSLFASTPDLEFISSYISHYDKSIVLMYLNLNDSTIESDYIESKIQSNKVMFDENEVKEKVSITKYKIQTYKLMQ